MSASKILIATLFLTTSLYTSQSYAQSNEGDAPQALQMLLKKATGQADKEAQTSAPKKPESSEPVETSQPNEEQATAKEEMANTGEEQKNNTLPTRNILTMPSEGTSSNQETTKPVAEKEESNLPVISQEEKNKLDQMAPGNIKKEDTTTDIPKEKVDLPKVAAPQLNNLNQINNLNSEIAILELELKKAQLNKDIKTAQKEEKEATGENSTPVAPVQPQPQPQPQNQIPQGAYPPGMLPQMNNNMPQNQMPQMPQKSAVDYEREALPIVNLISGTNDKLTARLLLLGGSNRIVKEGTKIPGGFVVKSITSDNVILKGLASGEDHVLSFGNHYPQPRSQDNSNNMNNNPIVGGFDNQNFQGVPY